MINDNKKIWQVLYNGSSTICWTEAEYESILKVLEGRTIGKIRVRVFKLDYVYSPFACKETSDALRIN